MRRQEGGRVKAGGAEWRLGRRDLIVLSHSLSPHPCGRALLLGLGSLGQESGGRLWCESPAGTPAKSCAEGRGRPAPRKPSPTELAEKLRDTGLKSGGRGRKAGGWRGMERDGRGEEKGECEPWFRTDDHGRRGYIFRHPFLPPVSRWTCHLLAFKLAERIPPFMEGGRRGHAAERAESALPQFERRGDFPSHVVPPLIPSPPLILHTRLRKSPIE